MSERAYDLDIKNIEILERLLKEKMPSIKVGIFSNKKDRKYLTDADGDIDNVDLGIIHEFGSETTPERSFLRMPLSEKMDEEIENSGLLEKSALEDAVKERSIIGIAQALATMAESVIAKAFATGGFGKWEQLKEKTMLRKEVKMILVESQQLRDSITSKVEND